MKLFMTQAEALAENFTHHGRMFSVPVWLGGPDDCPMVAAKFAPFELWIELCTYVVQAMSMIGWFPDGFPILICGEIQRSEK
jgi:hypothetical protein